MVSLDLYRRYFPTALKTDTSEMRRARSHDVLELHRHRPGSRKATKVDPGLMANLLSGLVEAVDGKPLSETLGFSNQGGPAYGRLIGLNLTDNQFQSFLDSFHAALGQLGLVGPVSRARADDHASDIPSPMGTRTKVQRDILQCMTRFDEFASLTVDQPSLQAALDAGNADGVPPGLFETISALLGALKAAVRADDSDAIRRIGSDFGSLAAALHEATRGGTAQRAAKSGGHVRVRRATDGRVAIKKVRVGREFLDIKDTGMDEHGRLVIRHRTKRG